MKKIKVNVKTGEITEEPYTAAEIKAVEERVASEKPERDRQEKRAALSASDKDMARVAEDIIGLLIEKELIAAEEIPQPVKDKLAARAALRQELAALEAE